MSHSPLSMASISIPVPSTAEDGDVTVFVELSDGTRHVTTFVTPQALSRALENENRVSHDVDGDYFWDSYIVVVREFNLSRVPGIVQSIFNTGTLDRFFMHAPQHLQDG
jgi:hypothetical protein